MIRAQYHFRPSKKGFYAWDVRKLAALAGDVAITNVPLNAIRELDEAYWYSDPRDMPSVRAIVAHMKLVERADRTYPIILCADGRVMDGMHRVAQALLHGDICIAARRFMVTPPPDHTDIMPADLPYD